MDFINCLRLKKDFHQLKLSVFSNSNNYLDLSIVNPDLQPEKQIIDKLLEFSLQNNAHRYSSAQGLPELRQAIAGRYQSKYQVKIDWQKQVTIARGTNAAISNILNLFYKKNLRKPKILLPSPTYSMHMEIARQAGESCFFYSLDQNEEQLISSLKNLISANKIDLLLLNFPNNPTGKLVSAEFYQKLTNELKDSELWIINDFVYSDLTFSEGYAASLLRADSKLPLFEVYSLSKSFSLAGWRLALILGQPEMIGELIQNQTEIDYGAYQGFQRAAAFALTAEVDYSKVSGKIYQNRAARLSSRLQELKIEVKSEPAGCFLWCRLPEEMTMSSYEFCKALLINHKLAIQPGEIFGENLEKFFRVSLTANDQQLSEAAERIARLCSTDNHS